MAEPKQHALYAASSSDRWINCPASLKLIARAPKPRSSAAADEGTLAHELMELCLINKVDVGHYENEVVFDDDLNESEKYPFEMRMHIQGFLNYVRSLVYDIGPHAELLVEEKVYLDFIHPTEAFGTVDVAIIEPFGTLHIIDLKYGMGHVGHRNNSQMLYYALGIAHKHQYDFEQIKTTIYQPRTCDSDDPWKIARTDSFHPNKLHQYRGDLVSAVHDCETADEDTDLNAGSWCKFCPAKIICPAITRTALKQAQLDFMAPVQPDPKSLTSDQLKAILDRSAYLELWIKEVKAYAEDKIRSGMKVDGWGIVPTRAKRVWAEPNGDIKYVTARLKVMDDINLFSEELMTPPQAEKVLKKHWTKEEVEEFMNDYVVSISGGDKLSPINEDYNGPWPDDMDID